MGHGRPLADAAFTIQDASHRLTVKPTRSLVNMRDAIVSSPSTREAILDATDRLLARYGYKKMTIEDLAREVGIGKGSVYLHFPSKEEIALFSHRSNDR